jgi:hypothetical protein
MACVSLVNRTVFFRIAQSGINGSARMRNQYKYGSTRMRNQHKYGSALMRNHGLVHETRFVHRLSKRSVYFV